MREPRGYKSKMTMPAMGMGEGSGQNLGLDKPKYTRSYAPGELAHIEFGELSEKYLSCVRYFRKHTALTPRQAKRLLRAWNSIDPTNEDELETARDLTQKAVRQRAVLKSKATRAMNKRLEQTRQDKIDQAKGDGVKMLKGSRWVTLLWVRKDWERRIETFKGVEDAIFEIRIMDPKLPVAFVRVPVIEEKDIPKGVNRKRDCWGRYFAVTAATKKKVRQVLGAIALVTEPHQGLRDMKAVATYKGKRASFEKR